MLHTIGVIVHRSHLSLKISRISISFLSIVSHEIPRLIKITKKRNTIFLEHISGEIGRKELSFAELISFAFERWSQEVFSSRTRRVYRPGGGRVNQPLVELWRGRVLEVAQHFTTGQERLN